VKFNVALIVFPSNWLSIAPVIEKEFVAEVYSNVTLWGDMVIPYASKSSVILNE
jgi:hypothetical protein